MEASPAKLPDDTWGVRVYDPGQAGAWTGQAFTVQAKSGKSWTSVLTGLVSHNEAKGVALYRPAAKKAKAAPAQAPTLFSPAPLPPIAGGAPDEGEPTPKTGTFNPLTPDEPIAWDAPEGRRGRQGEGDAGPARPAGEHAEGCAPREPQRQRC